MQKVWAFLWLLFLYFIVQAPVFYIVYDLSLGGSNKFYLYRGIILGVLPTFYLSMLLHALSIDTPFPRFDRYAKTAALPVFALIWLLKKLLLPPLNVLSTIIGTLLTGLMSLLAGLMSLAIGLITIALGLFVIAGIFGLLLFGLRQFL